MSYWNEPAKDLIYDEFTRIVNLQFPKLKAISITGIGEPFLNKDFLRMIEYLKNRNKHVSFSTNFTLINERTAKEIVKLGVDQIYSSIDGATKETYEKIRVGATFENVIRNIRSLMQIKEQMSSAVPVISLAFVITKLNIHEVPLMIRLARELGIPRLGLTNAILFTETEHLAAHETEKNMKKWMKIAGKQGIFLNFEFFSKKPIESCPMPWGHPFITHDGYVLPCCLVTQSNSRNVLKEKSFGNVFKTNFEEIWRSDEFDRFRESILKGEAPEICTWCPAYSARDNSTSMLKDVPLIQY